MKKIFLIVLLILIGSSIYSQIPNPPTLISPLNGAVNVSLFPVFQWQASSGATSYRLQILNGPATVFDQSGITGTSYVITTAILTGNTYYTWHMNATNSSGTSSWSVSWNFTTSNSPPPAPILIIPPNGTVGVPIHPTLDWNAVPGATAYILHISKSQLFDSLVVCDTTPFAPITLEYNTLYYWRVCAINSGGIGPWSSIWHFTTMMQTPLAPILLSPPNNSNVTPPVILDWSDVLTATGYRIQISISLNFAQIVVDQNTTVSQYTFMYDKLQQRTVYYWRTAVINPGGQGQYSTVWSFYTGSISPPDPPALLGPPDSSVVTLFPVFDWTDVPGGESYRIQISTSPNFSTTVLNIGGLSNSGYIIASAVLMNNTLYYWRVNASNSGGTSPWSSVWRFITAPAPPLTPVIYPVNRGKPVYADSSTIFEWHKVNTATSYRIQIATSTGFQSPIIDLTVFDTIYIAPPGTFTSNVLYYGRVNASNSGGTSPWSTVWSFHVVMNPPNPPVLLLPLNNATDVSLIPTLDWNDVAGATSYRVQVSQNQNFNNPIVNTTTSSSSSQFTILSGVLSNNTQYYWRVNASNTGGTSNWSDVWNFTTMNQIGIKLISSEVPAEYKLYNNYPNPFNPTTIIRFHIKELSSPHALGGDLVTLKIFDILGKELVTLVNEKLSPGKYEVSFDGSNLPNGIYFYTIRSGDFTDTKKMLLIK